MRASRQDGFTLIEMIAVVVLTTIVLTVAINFFIDLSRASNQSTDRMRAERRATALLDRLAHELEGAYLVKKPKTKDPLEHPWLFLAEASGSGPGADRLKFMTRTAIARTSTEHESDVTVVSYGARPGADGGIEVLRRSESHVPQALDRNFALDEGSDALVLASGLASFGVRFLDEQGSWQDRWDSSQLTDSSELPIGAEISVTMLAPESATRSPSSAAAAAEPPAALGPYIRRVLIPIRPVDLEAMLKPDEAAAAEAAGKDGKKKGDKDSKDGSASDQANASDAKKQEEQCMTVAQCLALNPGVVQQFPQIQGIITAVGGQCFRDVAGSIPPGVSLVGCQ
jgi:prepilin-type N-terminal cleavage/methylation domain-containing protein